MDVHNIYNSNNNSISHLLNEVAGGLGIGKGQVKDYFILCVNGLLLLTAVNYDFPCLLSVTLELVVVSCNKGLEPLLCKLKWPAF